MENKTSIYGQYKNDFILFDKSKSMMDYYNEQLYFNVYFCYLQKMLEHLHETKNPHNEWIWLRGQYKKGMKYSEYTLGLTNIVDHNVVKWSYEEMLHNTQGGKRFCMLYFDSQSPEDLLQEIENKKNSNDSIWNGICRFFGRLFW